MANLVICCDGTWNVPDELRQGVAAPTNVAKLALGVLCTEASDQKLFYEPGVGTNADTRVIGGAFGYGLSANIKNAYRFLAQEYRPGDQLFLFGFSRGAYTARSLAGLIRNCGLLTSNHVDRVDDAFAFYRDRTSTTHPDTLASNLFRRMYSYEDDTIHFIGVWDTVGALGIPTGLKGSEELSKLNPNWEKLWGFHDTQLGRHVQNAFHALSIDEQRDPFRPTLWTSANPGQTVEQVWFAGVHSEVGGGSLNAELSDIALLWMVEQATQQRSDKLPLQIDRGALGLGDDDGAGQPIAPNYAGPIKNSRSHLYRMAPAYHRLAKAPADAPGQSFASSAVRRRRDAALDYDPPAFDAYHRAVGERTTIVVESSADPGPPAAPAFVTPS